MSIEDRLDHEAVGWRPEPGDKLIGTIISIDEGTSGEWGPYPLLEVEQGDGTCIALHAFHSVLRNAIASKRPQVGDTIGVKYIGKVNPKGGGNAYENYRVQIERAAGAPEIDWDAHEKASAGAPGVAGGDLI